MEIIIGVMSSVLLLVGVAIFMAIRNCAKTELNEED